MQAELDETLQTLAQYTDYPGAWGGLSSVHAGGASAFFAPDMSSNVRLLLNAAQGVEQAALYSAFGVKLSGTLSQPLGFGGGLGYFDDGLDRLYVRARHYRPGLGAWMSRDPLGGLLGGYGYVGNSPVGWVDPSGWQGQGYEAEGYLGDRLRQEWDAGVEPVTGAARRSGEVARDNWTTTGALALAGPSIGATVGHEYYEDLAGRARAKFQPRVERLTQAKAATEAAAAEAKAVAATAGTRAASAEGLLGSVRPEWSLNH